MRQRFTVFIRWILFKRPAVYLPLPTYYLPLFVCIASCLSCGQPAEEYVLVWSDEFDKNGKPDTANWNYEQGFARNHELQWYQPENAVCKDGLLVIEARRETTENPGYDSTGKDWRQNRQYAEYSSSCLITRGKHEWQYGRFELRAKIPTDSGMWPAWWTLGVKEPWPANGEIDIMEYYRDTILANLAFLGADGKTEWYDSKHGLQTFGENFANEFHVWKMDWTEAYIALYVDDILLNKVELNRTTNKNGSGFNPFQQPHYMLLNLAIGGMNGGDPTGTLFPQQFEVDYVRVYQKKK